jgi:anaerobic ribonucleoside-triphosphate reductase activating protein
MLIHGIIPMSQANGPGERFTVWTQGCSRGCPGCFNPATHEDKKMKNHDGWLSLLTCYRKKKARQGSHGAHNAAPEAYVQNGLPTTLTSTIFHPAGTVNEFPAELSIPQIISRIPRGRVSGISVSGGEPFEQPEDLARLLLAARKLGLHTLVYSGFTYEELRCAAPEVLCEIDMLIDGPYIRGIPRTSPWTGSGNQRVLCLREGKVVLWDSVFSAAAIEGEIFIDSRGAITETGIFSLAGSGVAARA